MKISNSKKQLAKIIHENGGWREGAQFSAQDKDGEVFHYSAKPTLGAGREVWGHKGCIGEGEFTAEKLPNWHQTILLRDEYFHLYPAPDADGWIEWLRDELPVEMGVLVDVRYADGDELYGAPCGVDVDMTSLDGSLACAHVFGAESDIIAYRLHKPEQSKSTAVGDDETNLAAREELEAMEFVESPEQRAKLAKIYAPSIEQLAADYRAKLAIAQQAQEEADSHRCGAESALEKLVAAGRALGLVLSVAAPEPELVITDWRDLQVGDEVECLQINITGGDYADDRIGSTGIVVATEEPGKSGQAVKMRFDDGKSYWAVKWRFIRRPAKGGADA